ncbi:DUF6894 family protein [Methylobacterium nigriterrae]|uniref:DUF6894 family protein n=1 Tax=Methylobacterium nigriterrae TaxID=3127512 RepID=UPI003013339A
MARYFFDFADLYLALRDEEGTECSNPKAVSSEALRALCQIAGERPEKYADQMLNVVVRDASDRAVFTASLNLSAAWHAEQGQSEAA